MFIHAHLWMTIKHQKRECRPQGIFCAGWQEQGRAVDLIQTPPGPTPVFWHAMERPTSSIQPSSSDLIYLDSQLNHEEVTASVSHIILHLLTGHSYAGAIRAFTTKKAHPRCPSQALSPKQIPTSAEFCFVLLLPPLRDRTTQLPPKSNYLNDSKGHWYSNATQ